MNDPVSIVITAVSLLIAIRYMFLCEFKIVYYETKLENRGVDISHIKDAGVTKIIKMTLK